MADHRAFGAAQLTVRSRISAPHHDSGLGGVSSQNVTGPSLISDTCMCAPKPPKATGAWAFCAWASRYSNRAAASAGGAARVKEARLPRSVSAASVNWGISNRRSEEHTSELQSLR